MIRNISTAILSTFLLINSCLALPPMGVKFSYPAMIKDPADLLGMRGSFWVQPQSLIWCNRFQLYFEAGYAHWKVSGAPVNRTIDIYTVFAPVFRAYITQDPYFSTYAEFSIGAAYMNRTRLNNSNFGIHYTFQDYAGLGALIGEGQRVSLSLEALHYSNGSLSDSNSGITVPIMVTLGYRFC